MITQNIEQIRSTPEYRDAFILMYIEANMSPLHANAVRRLVSTPRYSPIHVLEYEKDHELRPGVITGAVQKEEGARHLARELFRNQLVVAENLITTDEKAAVRDLADQMRQFREELKIPTDAIHGTVKRSYTGKSSQGNKRDDRVVALQLSLYWSEHSVQQLEVARILADRGIEL